MSNKVYSEEIYNEEIKLRFINEFLNTSHSNLLRIFKVSCKVEKDLGIDLYDFNREQIKKLGFLFAPSTKNSSKQNINQIKKYIDWAIDEGLINNFINPLSDVSNEWKEQFVSNIKIFWTKDEINKVSLKCKNKQDGVIPSLLFHGIWGKENSEIVNLRKSDINEVDKTLTVTDKDKTTRVVRVDQECIDLCMGAYAETVYQKRNGNSSPNSRNDVTNLVENEYIIRSSHTRTDHFDVAESNIVYRRLEMIREEIVKNPMFNPKNIVYSGALHMAYQLYRNKGSLKKEDYVLICRQYGFGREKDGVWDVNFSKLKSDFLNLDVIRSLYPDVDSN